MIVRKVQRLHHSLVVTIPRTLASKLGIIRGNYVVLQVVEVAGEKMIAMMKMKEKKGIEGEIRKENGR